MIFHIDISASSIPQTILSSVQNAMRAYTWALVDQAICSITLAQHDAINYKKKREQAKSQAQTLLMASFFQKKILFTLLHFPLLSSNINPPSHPSYPPPEFPHT